MKSQIVVSCLLTAVLCSLAPIGCSSLKPLKPGHASIQSTISTNGVHQFVSELKQPENPAQSASQNFERTTETELPIPAQSIVQETTVTQNEQAQPLRQQKTIVLAAPVVQKTRTTEKAGTLVGAAQKDTAREIGAKLSNLKGIVWLGAAMFIFGLATLAYPPLRALIGSVTTSAAIIVGGLVLMILPSLIVGNELLILGGVALAVGAWFLAHRHGHLRGMLNATNPDPST